MPNPENLRPPWKPGQSGNPNGKKKGCLNTKTILRKFLSVNSGNKHPVTGEELNCLEHALLKGITKAMRGDLPFLKELLDRLDGKPNQKVDVTERKPDDLETMSIAELKDAGKAVLDKLNDELT